MKKLMKAVAFVTVMCMLLSTAAFASDYGTAEGDKTEKLIDINVTNVGASEQVVLLVVKTGVAPAAATEADIMYIDQKQAGSDETASFLDIAIMNTETVVDIYVGSAETGGAQFIGTVDVTDVKVITLATEDLGDDAIITEHSVSANGKMSGFGAAITVNIPVGLTVDKMIWGFELSDGVRHYTEADAYDVSHAEGCYGNVQFAAAFNFGYMTEATVERVSAIFLTGEGTADEMEHYTDEANDKPNKAE